MEIIEKYFAGELTPLRQERFARLSALYEEWNGRINVVSRKDLGQLYPRHVLHSLAIAKVCRFDHGARILDAGTGGGFPGIPLAIMFPDAQFTLADSIGKKIAVVKGIVEALGLDNVCPVNMRAEQLPGRYDYVVSRAVTGMKPFLGWIWDKIDRGRKGSLPNGVLYLKGGDLAQELAEAAKPYTLYDIGELFPDEGSFDTKKVVYIRK